MGANVNLFALLAKQARIQGINLGHHRSFEDFNKVLDQININPVEVGITRQTIYRIKNSR
ncbi:MULTISPECIES: hypothetical protein [Staphylococcus]|uniref:hypothetical protein n=1 Tax=Staphylococcus TaxID=1279 RepID=UPI00048D260D|nr:MULTISPECIES: hypothetical protein [Staphylococcus]